MTSGQGAWSPPYSSIRPSVRQSPIYERLHGLGFNDVFEVTFGLTHTPDHTKANMWGEMQDWLLKGAIETDEKMAMYLADPTTGIWR